MRGQGTHADADVAPVALDHDPAGHSAHPADPGEAAYSPGPQGAHSDESLAPVAGDAVPTGHSRQPLRDWPDWSLNVPAGHRAHVVTDVAPGAVPYQPATHEMHDVDPGDVEYDPTGHVTHTVPDA